MQEIIDRANVGRATFYAHYERMSRATPLRFVIDIASLKAGADDRVFAFSHELFAHASGHRDLFRAMVGKRSGALVEHLLRGIIVNLVRDEVTAKPSPREPASTTAEAAVQFLAGGLFGLLVWWSAGKMRPPAEDVDAIFRRLAVPALKAGLR